MPQLHLYVPEEVAEKIRKRAEVEDLSVSAYLAKLVKREIDSKWPEGFWEKYTGFWEGPSIEIEQLPVQERDFEFPDEGAKADFRSRFYGSWQGDPLERGEQGEYPVREEMK